MTINYQSILDQLKGLFQGLFITNLPMVQQTALIYLKNHEKRLIALAKNTLSGSLSKEVVIDALKAEAEIALNEVNSFEVIGLSIAQDTINNVLQPLIVGIFTQAVVTPPTTPAA